MKNNEARRDNAHCEEMPPPHLAREFQQEKERIARGQHTVFSILIGGAAGSGIETVDSILAEAFKSSGYYVYSTKEYMSRVRGGSNSSLIRISDTRIEAPCWPVDLCVALDNASLEHTKERWHDKTLILTDTHHEIDIPNLITLPMKEQAKAFGSAKYVNTFTAGLLFGMMGIDIVPLLESINKHFQEDSVNAQVAQRGYEEGVKYQQSFPLSLPKQNKEMSRSLHLMDGTTACGFGFLAGGCDMVTAYPMSPSTGVLNFMAAASKEFTIAVEQSEDEIASLHMVLGGWYAGARAMTTTSGGGFALMGEALSLSGISETPAVIYLAQRPGPATGMPTRSEQGDLNLALYSGHGPFQRIILAPGTLEACIACGHLAFELADYYQVPVIVLSDQYLADTKGLIERIDFSSYDIHPYIIATDQNYLRYADTPDGISPRGIPAIGEGLIRSVGHEHDDHSQITEDYKVREQMVAKRVRKAKSIEQSALLPRKYGDGDIAIIGWGSTFGAIREALSILNDPRLSHIHFDWVHPLTKKQLEGLDNYTHRIVIENNADGSFSDQLRLHEVKIDKQILQYNGFAFFEEQLAQMITTTLKEL